MTEHRAGDPDARDRAEGVLAPAALAGLRVAVLGGTGFIGRRLARRARARGASVVATGRTLPEADSPPAAGWEGIALRALDLCGPAREIDAVLDGVDVVCNLAGQSGQVASLANPRSDLEINQGGALAVLEAVGRVAPRARVVFSSSRLVYGRPESIPVATSHPTAPTSFYGTHKLAAELYHRIFERCCDLSTTVLRITNPYGPRPPGATPDYGIVNWFCELALRGQPLPIFGDGGQLRDYCYVDDVVDAILLAAVRPAAAGAVYNVGAGAGTPFVEMAKAVCAAVEGFQGRHHEGRELHCAGLTFREWPDEAAKVETGDFVADVTGLERALGWRPSTDLATGLRLTIAHYLGVDAEHAAEGAAAPTEDSAESPA